MRRATRADIGAVVSLLKSHHTEHDFPFSFDPALVSLDIAHVIEDSRWLCLVAGRCLLLGYRHRPPLVPVMVASEVMLRCEKPGMRKLFVAEFERWARSQGCSIVALATTHSVPVFARLYVRDGYRLAEAHFIKVL